MRQERLGMAETKIVVIIALQTRSENKIVCFTDFPCLHQPRRAGNRLIDHRGLFLKPECLALPPFLIKGKQEGAIFLTSQVLSFLLSLVHLLSLIQSKIVRVPFCLSHPGDFEAHQAHDLVGKLGCQQLVFWFFFFPLIYQFGYVCGVLAECGYVEALNWRYQQEFSAFHSFVT